MNSPKLLLQNKEKDFEILGFSPSLGSLSSIRESFLMPSIKFNDKGIKEVHYNGFIDKEDLENLVLKYESWVKTPVYLSFHKKSDSSKKVFRLCSKRGNSVYSWRTKKRLEKSTSFFESKSFKNLLLRKEEHSWITNVLFITLTNDSKRYGEINYTKSNVLGEKELVHREGNRILAWGNGEKNKGIQSDYNRFITAFRKRYGKSWVLKVFESFKSGYPHVHLLLIGERPWKVKRKRRVITLKNGSTRVITEYRLSNYKEKEKISDLWHSFVDIKAVQSLQTIKNYLYKDVVKQFKGELDNQSKLSLTLNWLFRKRSFSVSGLKVLNDLISESITQTELTPKIEVFDDYVFDGLIILRLNVKDPPFLIEKTLNSELEEEFNECIS